MRLHTQDLFTCSREGCDKKYQKKGDLEDHIRIIHLGIAYKCDVCCKEFQTKTGLRCHKMTHEGTEPYRCDTCGKRFTFKTTYTSHMARHTGEYPYKCTCGKSYRHSSSLTYHKQVCGSHGPVTRVSCDVCSKTFKSTKTLRDHMVVHDNKDGVQCPQCGLMFNHRSTLRKHLQRKH